MKTTEFTMPEITISYKDNVKASKRVKILSSETSYSFLETVLYRMYGTPRRKLCNVPQPG